MYYLNKTLVDVETRYFSLEKMALTLVHATRKLPHYFQAYRVWVLIKYPLQLLLRWSDFTGRIVEWGTRLRTFDIRYKLRNSIKGLGVSRLCSRIHAQTRSSHWDMPGYGYEMVRVCGQRV